MSACTPKCPIANQRPVRPKPVTTWPSRHPAAIGRYAHVCAVHHAPPVGAQVEVWFPLLRLDELDLDETKYSWKGSGSR